MQRSAWDARPAVAMTTEAVRSVSSAVTSGRRPALGPVYGTVDRVPNGLGPHNGGIDGHIDRAEHASGVPHHQSRHAVPALRRLRHVDVGVEGGDVDLADVDRGELPADGLALRTRPTA